MTGSTRARWLLAGAIAGLAGCATPERPNVVLVTFDTTRADHLSTYGYEKPTSPELSRIARGGVIFEDCLSAVPITFPSHSTILTGTFPTRHGGRDNGGFYLAD
ncbi:MAG TPA: sulfatase-like hydrolase/transferase, partial [Acidobacteriota bacterium]